MALNDPSNFTTELAMKFVPFTVMENCASPTVLEVGTILVVVGAGLFTVKVCALEVPPPGVGLVTVISMEELAVSRSVDKMVAVS